MLHVIPAQTSINASCSHPLKHQPSITCPQLSKERLISLNISSSRETCVHRSTQPRRSQPVASKPAPWHFPRTIIHRLGLSRPSRTQQPRRKIHQLVARNQLRKPNLQSPKERKKKTSTIPNPSQPTDLLHFHLPRRSRRAKLVVRRLETTPREPHYHFLDVSWNRSLRHSSALIRV
jgi:hypothetical protein